MKIFVTGACGYKGTVLVPKLLEQGYEVTAFDIQWFGNQLRDHPALTVVQGDIRNVEDYDLTGHDAVIHLSSIANDPAGDLNPKLTWEVSCLATALLADKCKRHGIERFIYASSGSVYGIKDEEHVTENLELVPITEYNKTKMCGERILLSYSDDMVVQIVRPATVCGFSPTMRNDVSVNILTMLALENGKITVFGGDQVRPNVHIDDITDLYIFLLENPEHDGIFNAGFENISIMDIARKVQEHVDAEIVVTPSNDPRSYRVNSDRLLATGFRPKKTVDDAIKELVGLYRQGAWTNDDSFHRMKFMASDILDQDAAT
ncbi:NAD(P)-dependent oxidoreductase [Ahrensia sp. R2A130]|uniref:NAD-dependent epimerase/dehydratase family protein n=1 Tax=Ahrensia sp. R2A130 TaxID=744979 RepID=UPI0001E08C2F|nr:SDR family oxidoreductase [Ahrensia sp. R2A130]EFL89533.1 NAD-dependent epimerase/dehydratase [Ahrensia sp. R2A130]